MLPKLCIFHVHSRMNIYTDFVFPTLTILVFKVKSEDPSRVFLAKATYIGKSHDCLSRPDRTKHFYGIKQFTTWIEASTLCQSQNMSLAEFASMNEFRNFVSDFKKIQFRNVDTYFWLGGNALDYLLQSKGRQVPTEEWRWFTSGRVMDLPREAWGSTQPDRGYWAEKKAYESCIALKADEYNIHDYHCDGKLATICQEIVQGNEEPDKK